MSRFLVDSLTDKRALLNCKVFGALSDVVAPVKKYLDASSAKQITVFADCVFALTSGGVFRTQNTVLTEANLDSDTFSVGTDYYVYLCDTGSDADEKYIISKNSTYPSGYNADTSRKIGGFHFGKCRKSLTANDVYDGIVPASVWTLLWRPACSPEGMVYIGGGTWLDIYINSDDGNGGLLSKYHATPITGTEGLNWYIAQERLRRVGKRMPSYGEWCKGAEGSPQGLDASNAHGWTATSNEARQLTGYVANATSLLGLRDCAGNVWEWLDELCLDPMASNWNLYDVMPGYGQIYMPSSTALHALIAGGNWRHGVHCGARAVFCNDYPWNADPDVGVRGACDAV
nr:MAG TPA: major tropism determinant [Caudoviricetes sp.]